MTRRVSKAYVKRTQRKHWTHLLKQLGACSKAIKWARQFKTPQAAWRHLIDSPDAWGNLHWVVAMLLEDWGNAFDELWALWGQVHPECPLSATHDEYQQYQRERFEFFQSGFPVPGVKDLQAAVDWQDPTKPDALLPWVLA